MRILFLIILSSALAGCAGFDQSPIVAINAIAAKDAMEFRTYTIAPRKAEAAGLEFDQYAEQVQSVLAAKGFARVIDPKIADVVILLDTNLGDAQTATSTGVVPQWGQTGYSGAQTHGSYIGNQYQANTYYTPTYGVTGYVPYTATTTYYQIGFSLGAWRRPDTGKDAIQIWNIAVSANSETGDLRRAFPQMLEGAKPYIANDSGGIIKVRVPRRQ